MTTTNVTWQVVGLRCYPQQAGETDVVFQVEWLCTAEVSDGTKSSATQKNGVTDIPHQADQSFTPFEDLTQDQVLAWVWEQVAKASVEQMTVGEALANLAPPVIQPPLPWSQA